MGRGTVTTVYPGPTLGRSGTYHVWGVFGEVHGPKVEWEVSVV